MVLIERHPCAWVRMLVFCGLLLTPDSLRADPILITINSGFAETSPHEGRAFSLSGQDFLMTGGLQLGAIQPQSGPYAPGMVVPVAGSWTDSDVSSIVTFGGLTSRITLSFGHDALQFIGDPVTLPTFTGQTGTVITPFLFSGRVQERDFIDAMLSGQGIATLTFLRGVDDGWYPQLTRYEFQDAAPVPEPSTLLLIAPVLLLGARRFRRRTLG